VKAPGLFKQFVAASGHEAAFVAFDVRAEDVGAFFEMMRVTENLRGGFVTVPHPIDTPDTMSLVGERCRREIE
jgi:shikimate 5-dehydrogenase